MHDIAELETRGLPGVFVASTEFVAAAETQARALGVDPARVFVPHPIQDRTDDEIRALAEAAADEVLAAAVATGTQPPGP
ncbi:MAG: hypothetical protein E6G01_07240 [Actinobacteria bacterium]|nr:MAG: hypothetical protein E6G01_07240 [Actinomycetota bacterium]